jgi:hypothetical protein
LPPPETCAPEPALPGLGKTFLPSVDGALSLVSARGDARLSARGGIRTAWSADGAYLVFADSGALSVWRTADGALVDLVQCGRDIGAYTVAMSSDLRWLVATGTAQDPSGFHAATCVVDRKLHSARVLPVQLQSSVRGSLAFDAFGCATGDTGEIELATGAVHHPRANAARLTATVPTPVLPARHFPADLVGASRTVESHDGHYLAAWTVAEVFEELGGGSARERRLASARIRDQDAPHFVAVWDLTTGKRLWKGPNPVDDDWQFSPDDRFLEAPPTRGGNELVRVTTGEVLLFPGLLSPMAPDGQRVMVLLAAGPELWAVDPPTPLLAPARPRRLLARAPDGLTAAAFDGRAPCWSNQSRSGT